LIRGEKSDKIRYLTSREAMKIIYGPWSNADYYGTVWGRKVVMLGDTTLYYDAALKDKYTSDELTLTSWKDDRN
ncbi:MAG: hypothetical protein Q7J27_10345, partial [Syntrophales bacterium]|nr:hypothetical protein [Syntrophales bacterium]